MYSRDPIGIDESSRRRSFDRPTRALALASALALVFTTPSLAQTTQDSGAATDKRCLYVSSYHRGDPWSDGVERGLRSVLGGHCEIKQVDMDTKRNKDNEYKVAKSLEIKALVESWSPDVVITSDDNAAKFLIKPYFKDAATPFVFCGVNWTADEYGFPYDNVTGMVEVAPIQPMLRSATSVAGGAKRVLYLGADTLTEEKNLARFVTAAKEFSLELDSALVGSTDAWLAAYEKAQDYDFIIMGSNAGIGDWDVDKVKSGIAGTSKKLSVTSHDWMMPFTMLGFTKIAEEQGEWAANTAIALMNDTPPRDIPITANRKWDLWMNEGLVEGTQLKLPRSLTRRAKRVSD